MTFFRFAVSCGFRNVFTTLNVRVSVSIIDQNPINGSKKKKAHVTTLSLGVCTSGRVHNGINVVCID